MNSLDHIVWEGHTLMGLLAHFEGFYHCFENQLKDYCAMKGFWRLDVESQPNFISFLEIGNL